MVTPRELLLALVVVAFVCVVVGAVRLVRAVSHLLRRDFAGALVPLEAKVSQTMGAVESSLARIETLETLVPRAERAVETILAGRAGVQRAGSALKGSFRDLHAEWRRLRATLN